MTTGSTTQLKQKPVTSIYGIAFAYIIMWSLVNMAETAEECPTSSENEVHLSIFSFHNDLLLPIYV